MPNKYPGGYKIIDLGDLSKITDDADTTIEIPGIYDLINDSSKPVVLTGTGATSVAGIDAAMLCKAKYSMDNADAYHIFSFEWINLTSLTISKREAIIITTADKVLDAELE